MSLKQSALTPKAKGTGQGREVLMQGPYIMTPGGSFQPATIASAMDVEQSMEQEEFAFPLDGPAKQEKAADGRSSGSAGASTSHSAPDHAQSRRGREYCVRQLFGGAITCTLPASFEDVSVIRLVPDHQEVFVDRNTEISLIIEILSRESEIPDENAAQHFFQDLAQCNESGQYVIDSAGVISDPSFVPHLRPTFPRCALIGRQTVVKFSKPGDPPDALADLVEIFLVALRLEAVDTDLLITLNAPRGQVDRQDGLAPAIPVPSITQFLGAAEATADESRAHYALEVVQKVLKSFNIVDWALFA